MKTHDVGTIGELQFAAKAISFGYSVYFPANGTQQGHDLVIEMDGQFSRVQVRTVNLMSSSGCTRVQVSTNGCRNKPVPKDSYDLIAIVCLDLATMWLIPQEDVGEVQTISKSIPKLHEWDRYKF